MNEDELGERIAKAYDQGQQDLYEWIHSTVHEWYDLKITDDKQHIKLLELTHELDKIVYYKFKD